MAGGSSCCGYAPPAATAVRPIVAPEAAAYYVAGAHGLPRFKAMKLG